MKHHDVFISYSSKDKATADALVHYLEESKIRCWIAPRDILPGAEYAEVIDAAIRDATIFVMLFSEASQQSAWCKKEANLAVANCRFILPVKIEDVALQGSMRLYLSDKHWVDAIPEPNDHFSTIRDSILRIMGNGADSKTSPLPAAPPRRSFLTRMRIAIGGCLVCYGVFSLLGSVIAVFSGGCARNIASIALLALILLLGGSFLSRERVFSRFTTDSLSCLRPLRLLRSFIRVFFGAWIFMLGVALFLIFPGLLTQIIKESGAVSANGIMYSLSCAIAFSGIALAMVKTGLSMLESNWTKFNFSKKRFLKWALIVIVPFFIGVVGAPFFQSRMVESRPSLGGVVL